MTLFVYSPHDDGLRLEENFTSCVKTKWTQVSAGIKNARQARVQGRGCLVTWEVRVAEGACVLAGLSAGGTEGSETTGGGSCHHLQHELQ